MPERRAAVVGCGLIGASFCQALKKKRPSWRFAAIDTPDKIEAIADAGVADEVVALDEMANVLPGCELVLLAAPVTAIIDLIGKVAPHLSPGTVVTDVGSTKAAVMDAARGAMPDGVTFIGGHPLAGAEHSGAAAADPLLFNERVYLLCPLEDTPADKLLYLIDVVEDLRALPVTIEPEEHDRVMATISHAPQLLAIALLHAALRDDATHGLLDQVAGPGFLDLTRIAASDFGMWEGIFATNKKAVGAALDRLEKSLAEVKAALNDGSLESLWSEVSRHRRTMTPSSAPRMRKPELRHMIDRYDEQILRSLGNRMRAVRRIGKLKADQAAPVLDPDRERTMMQRRTDWAAAVDVPAPLVEELFSLIMKHSRALQGAKGESK